MLFIAAQSPAHYTSLDGLRASSQGSRSKAENQDTRDMLWGTPSVMRESTGRSSNIFEFSCIPARSGVAGLAEMQKSLKQCTRFKVQGQAKLKAEP
jgi:hypothetical protein